MAVPEQWVRAHYIRQHAAKISGAIRLDVLKTQNRGKSEIVDARTPHHNIMPVSQAAPTTPPDS